MTARRAHSRLTADDRTAIEEAIADLERLAMSRRQVRRGDLEGALIDIATSLRTVLIWSGGEKAAPPG